MNFNFIKAIIVRCIEIIIRPKEEWKKIKEENTPVLLLMRDFVFPLIILAVLTSMIGEYLRIAGTAFDQQLILLRGLRELAILTVSISLSIILVNEMLKTYHGSRNLDLAANLVGYSFVPLLIVSVLLGLSAWLYIVGLFALYLFYILFQGTPVLLQIAVEKQSNFSALASMVILMVYLMSSFVLSEIFKSFY